MRQAQFRPFRATPQQTQQPTQLAPRGIPLRAVRTQSFAASSPDALHAAVNAWISANAAQRTMLGLTFHVASAATGGGGTITGVNPGATNGTFSGVSATTVYAAFLTYTE